MPDRDMDHFYIFNNLYNLLESKEMGHHLAWQPMNLSPVLYALSFGCAYGPVLLSRVSSRPASGKRSDA